MEYVESLPMEVIAEFKALNAWSPFTPERQAFQLGQIASMISHQVYKKGMSPSEMFPYLKHGVPDFLEDERVAKARNLITGTMNAPEHIRKRQLETIRNAIREEIDLIKSGDYDPYVVRELTKLVDTGGQDGSTT